MKLREVLSVLRDAYCRHVGIEYTHILEPSSSAGRGARGDHMSAAGCRAEVHSVQAQRGRGLRPSCKPNTLGRVFSLEGGGHHPDDDAVIDRCADHSLREVIIGMPHRGRFNVLANIVGKPYSKIRRVRGQPEPGAGARLGDVVPPRRRGQVLPDVGDNEIAVSPPPTRATRGRRPGAGGSGPVQAGSAEESE